MMGKLKSPLKKSWGTKFLQRKAGPSWDYRILFNGETWWIGEVYYASDGRPDGYTDNAGALDGWSRQEDLISTYRLVGYALNKPYLRVYPNGSLSEDLSRG